MNDFAKIIKSKFLNNKFSWFKIIGNKVLITFIMDSKVINMKQLPLPYI